MIEKREQGLLFCVSCGLPLTMEAFGEPCANCAPKDHEKRHGEVPTYQVLDEDNGYMD